MRHSMLRVKILTAGVTTALACAVLS
ncbi:MAG: hypothetical protein JWR83_2927, partial [Aeromicrobium sp.]|nr:hypothetical protein [Aeromicrobium sp.]